MKTKLLYAEDIRNNLYSSLLNRDTKIDYREIYLAMDRAANFFAKGAFFENWKLGTGTIDDLWITDFFPVTATDPVNGNSFFTLPTSNYVTLPKNQGISDIYFLNDITKVTKKYFKPIIIKNFKDQAGFRSSLANDNQGRISCHIKNRIIYFDRGKINAQYGQLGIRLVLRDASVLQDTDVYPIPAEYEDQFIIKSILFFMEKRTKEADLIRDNNDTQKVATRIQ
jgi:hypothetical protein